MTIVCACSVRRTYTSIFTDLLNGLVYPSIYIELILCQIGLHPVQIEARSMACIVHDRTIGYVPTQSASMEDYLSVNVFCFARQSPV